ncbi:phytanoyl-CoA dioxygenase family protein [Mucilaginibacter sp. RS28]|uniref:Phytanoyl-CoA dioxygenase family protein n=1 Tax=Mucilaginibacter straminoryzae TaxID=2932774 RepID=A0A9X1X5B5_9SPHI|nr:phytanoyl-CoA dioxygenase family protein [Mucilaginibacter straminoryzae]MCJ8211362.1 phytanoyl-CoA dioxygenase family protein [Mucilaginibacter straminoryzae]
MTTDLSTITDTMPASTEVGKLGIMQLKRFWYKSSFRASAAHVSKHANEATLDKICLYILGLGLEQTYKQLGNNMLTFDEFEDWIITTAGMPMESEVTRFNATFQENKPRETHPIPSVLSAAEIDFWNENGYLIIKNAIPKEDCEISVDVICEHIGVDKNDPDTWYTKNDSRQGIMVQLFQHPILVKNRYSDKIRQVFEQLWQRTDIWVSADRVGFNPPETEFYKFQGPDLHWDCSLQLPVPYDLQGILYLNDVAANQGAFTLVPGFQHRLEDWIKSLPPGANPRRQNLHALGSKPIAAEAGDLIIWQQALPHGSSPNTSSKPRFVQYITYLQVDHQDQEMWV